MKTKLMSLMALLALASSVLLTGCNTVEGAGRDISAAGEAIEDTADDARN